MSEETKLQPAPLVGDSIEAKITANGIAMAITKLNSLRNGSASQPSPTIAIESNADQSEADQNFRYRNEERLRTDGRIDWEMLEVEVNGGEAALYGEVQTQDQKGLASLIVTTVSGMVGVTHSIIVNPGPYTKDNRLQKASWQSFRSVDALRQQTNRLTGSGEKSGGHTDRFTGTVPPKEKRPRKLLKPSQVSRRSSTSSRCSSLSQRESERIA